MIDNTGFGRGPTFDIEAFWRERSFSISAWSRGQTRVAVSGNQVIADVIAVFPARPVGPMTAGVTLYRALHFRPCAHAVLWCQEGGEGGSRNKAVIGTTTGSIPISPPHSSGLFA